MNLFYNMIRFEFGYSSLVSDIEKTLGWDESDFDRALNLMMRNHGDKENPIEDLFVVDESVEFELMKKLEEAIEFIAIFKLKKQVGA